MSINSHRIRYLSDHYRELLLRIPPENSHGLKLLDLGCGSMELTTSIAENNRDLASSITGMDIYEPDPGRSCEIDYLRWDGAHIPMQDNSIDVVIASDLIHHIYPAKERVFRETIRVAKWMIIKDHFEYSPVSRAILRGYDLIGNWRNALYGANVFPVRYFDEQTFRTLCSESGYEIASIETGHNVYGDAYRLIFPPRYQFIALLKRA